MTRFVLFLALALGLCVAPLAHAQEDQATLIADQVVIDADGNLIATGDIEIFFRNDTLTAAAVKYDAALDQIEIDGPLMLSDGTGNDLTADQATLTRDLQNGLVESARFMLQNQLRMEAQELERKEGRFSTLRHVAATSCVPCDGSKPLWQIRAAEVHHDALEKQVYFKNAQLRILDVPVFYLPYMRLPDPTVERARGFLVPSLKTTTLLGTGIKVPYFIPLGESRDITLTPYISTKTKTLETRYRQAFNSGTLTLNTALSQDDISTASLRAHGKVTGSFRLPRDYALNFAAESVSDDSYLGDYYDDSRDRITSNISISKTDDTTHREANLYHYRSLYESNATIPTIITYNRIQHRLARRLLGGPIDIIGEAHANYRFSDLEPDGRDMARLNGALLWSNQVTGPMGLRLGYDTQVRYDMFWVRQDSAYPDTIASATADTMVHLRWPLMKRGPRATHLFEPIAQIGYGVRDFNDIPNEESQRVEFDQGNLLSLSRFPAPDRYERGLRGAVGARWEMRTHAGYDLGITAAQVFRETANDAFSQSSGLRNTASDVLLALTAKTPFGVSVMGRGLFDAAGTTTKSEILANYAGTRFSIDAGYSHLQADAQEERSKSIREYSVSSQWQVRPDWTLRNNFRYDLMADKVATAGLGISYDAQCANVDFSVSRRFTETGTSPPQTTFGLTIALKGFSTGGASRATNTSCRN